MPSKIFSSELEGIQAKLVEVEVDLNVGLHAFNIVGLADKAVNEAKERVNSALKNLGVKPPNRDNRRITVNLAPAQIKKNGTHYDLPIAIGYLLATKQILQNDFSKVIFAGELSLDGRLRPIDGALNIAEMASENGFEFFVLPNENANEASAVSAIKIIPVETLKDVLDFLEGNKEILPHEFHERILGDGNFSDFSEIKGQFQAKRAAIISAAGGHNLLMVGPPGSGKSMIAKSLAGILPALTREESIEITKIYSASGLRSGGLIIQRPVRSPHQTASLVSVVGGGPQPRPGEASLAHRGILFLDELPEFPRSILEALRSPIEDGVINVSRAKGSLAFPAKFSLVAAMNPCPCGYYGDPEKECRCGAYDVIRYQKKVSGPLLDRIDLQVKVNRAKVSELRAEDRATKSESETIRGWVENARAIQKERFAGTGISTNSEMSSKQTETLAEIGEDANTFLNSLDKTKISPRGYFRLIKTARTIADLENSKKISADHLAEAWTFRFKEEV
jgi:magnesium chelatase family protein